MINSKEVIELTKKYITNHYNPLSIVISRGKGVWVEDPEGNRYIDMLGTYSASSFGHKHPKIIKAIKKQLDNIALVSNAFYNDQLCLFAEKLAKLTNKDMIVPMNTGSEAVDTAIKCARRWAYDIKKVPQDEAEIIVCENNFHGRNITQCSFSTDDSAKKGFGPFTPGFKIIPYDDIEALKSAISSKTAAFLVETIQCVAGVFIPKPGYLKEAFNYCKKNHILFIDDEVQTGFGRTGKLFACDWDNVKPDIYIFGKFLGGGILPISAIVGNKNILQVFTPGSHGSTFAGNPLASSIALASLEILEEEQFVKRSYELGNYFIKRLREIKNSNIKEIRGKGLVIGIEFYTEARSYCDRLINNGVLCKDTRGKTIRFLPPLIITKDELDWAIKRIIDTLSE